MDDNENLTKSIVLLKKEQEHSIVCIGEAMDDKGNAILARDQAYKELRLAQEARQKTDDLVKEKEDEISLIKEEHRYLM